MSEGKVWQPEEMYEKGELEECPECGGELEEVIATNDIPYRTVYDCRECGERFPTHSVIIDGEYMTHRPPYRAVLFYFDRPVTSGSEVEKEVPATNAFNTGALWKPSTALIQTALDRDFNSDRLWGWADDKQNQGPSPHDDTLRNAPPRSHSAWNGIYTALDNQIGVSSWWNYDEQLRRKGDVLTQEMIDDELIFRLDKTEQEIRNEKIPVPVSMTKLNPP